MKKSKVPKDMDVKDVKVEKNDDLGCSSDVPTVNILFKVSKEKRREIKLFAIERGQSLKDFFLELYENERLK